MKIKITVLKTDEENKTATLRFTAIGTNEEAEKGILCIQPPRNVVPFEYTEVYIDELEKNRKIELNLEYKFLQGGRFMFFAWEKNNKLQSLAKVVISMKGAGIYSGNTHSHSTYSDGKSTLEENRSIMMENGHSFIYATDHNTQNYYAELEEYKTKGIEENFLHIQGWEFTTKFGHSIAYGSKSLYGIENIPERNNVEAWQKYVDAMKEQNAVVYFAHPYEAPRYEFGDDVLTGIKGISGVEAWNGYNFHALAYQNRKNFEIWDAFNRRGDRHYAGNAVSDAHTMKGQSTPFIKGYLDELTREAVEKMLENGRFIGSNGPEIEFGIGDASIGQEYRTKAQQACMKLDVFDPLGDIEAVYVMKGMVDGEYTVRPNTRKVYEFYPVGENEKRNFVKTMYIDVKPGEFYRVEVVTGIGVISYTSDSKKLEKGFAFTNPIWIN